MTIDLVEPESRSEMVEINAISRVPQFPRLIGTFMGRDALSLAVATLGLNENDTVLLPVYTCQDVLAMFVGKCHVVFYDICGDLTIDPDEIRAQIAANAPIKLVLITNYFGFLQPHRLQIKQICSDRAIALIEDCAHSVLTKGTGEAGDFSIYSFRKILPLRDGGALGMQGPYPPPSPQYQPMTVADMLSLVALGKSCLNIRSERFSRARVTGHSTQASSFSGKDKRILPLSRFAKHTLAGLRIGEVIENRRNDFQSWREETDGNPGIIPLFTDLPAGVCPLGFVVLAKRRQDLENEARKRGIYLRVHWRLDSALAPGCKRSHQLSRGLLTLPIYPELTARNREILVGLVREL